MYKESSINLSLYMGLWTLQHVLRCEIQKMSVEIKLYQLKSKTKDGIYATGQYMHEKEIEKALGRRFRGLEDVTK